MKTFFLLSDDRRFDYLSQSLASRGFPVYRSIRNPVPEDSVVLFPLGAKKDAVLPVMDLLPRGSAVAVGREDPAIRDKAREKELLVIPLLEDEAYLSRNAVATAEGFLAECIGKTTVTLSDLTFLIIGYGNCGKAIARLLFLCGAEVYVHSRQGSMKRAEEDGFSVLPAFSRQLAMFDCIVNTVPEAIFPKDFFSLCREGTRFFQIASGLSGIDPEKAAKEGVFFHPLPALPAKYSPEGEADEILSVLRVRLFSFIPPESE